ncbi:AlpA family transcriptional regulator [Butyricimonas sp. Marseille-P3923]|uniref:helix-turn-helix transcriptional regulator n=1 Tax=Butyricimonas sp. Marseille-P3923 TaxID=1987504 RepID=UPI00210008D0|nr:helix-turn-helix domain-containing protein [Butyricimonas sp. Marseille-P3923]
MDTDFSMPLSDVIKILLKGEERELHERDLLGYVENLARGGKEALQQALKEVETAITGWNDSYFISTYEKRVDEFNRGKLNRDPEYLDDLFFKEELLIKEGKTGLTVDYLYKAIERLGFIDGNHQDAITSAWALDDFEFLKTQWEDLALGQIRALRAAIRDALKVVSPKRCNEVQDANRPQKRVIECPEVFGVDVCCEITGYKKNTVYKLTARGDMPCCRSGNNGRKLVFRREDIFAWMTTRRQETNDEFIKQMDGQLAARK